MSGFGIESPVSFTESAIKEIQKIITTNPNHNLRLRIGVKDGGCSGLSYLLELDHQHDEDMEYEIQGIPVIMNLAHGIYLLGMEIDYGKGLQARGFVFNNPNAGSTCGCGISFSV